MGGSSSSLSASSFHSCLSNASGQASESSCSDISSRTDGLLWDLEHNIHDGAAIEDFVEHVFHVTPKHINAILSHNWCMDPEHLKRYEAALSDSLDANPSSAFGALVADFAQKISNAIDGSFDAQTLSVHLRSTFPSVTPPEIISVPPPDAVYVDLTDEESDSLDSDADSLDKSFTSDKPHNSRLPLRPVTSADLQLIAYAAEALNAPECHYTTCAAVQSYSVTLWYYDRTCMVRTAEFDFRHQHKEFALFAYGISHKPKTPSPASRSPRCSLEDTLQSNFTTTDAKITVRPNTSGQHDATFTIIDTIYAYHALIGRGTKVFAVTLDNLDSDFANEEQVLKLAWPNVYRPQETKLVEAIVTAAPQWQAHLPQITFSATFSADQLLPRPNLLRTLPFKAFHDRYLHVMAMLRYQKLWEVDSVDEFEDAFVDCVECHFHSYKEGKVLHCDLSENNLMCKRDCGHIKGILNDWDMASPVDDNGDVSPSTKSYATGTIPFMAYDLLGENPPPHLYRHDLESFMYILIWAATHYNFTAKQKLPVASSLAGWDHKSRRVARQAKGAFLFDPHGTSPVFQNVRQEFRHVLDEWITPLHVLFSSAMASTPTPTDARTFDGRITFQTFMGVLGRKPR